MTAGAAAASLQTPEPTRRLPRRARTLWRLQAAGTWGLALLVGAGISIPLDGALAVLAWLAPLAGLGLGVLLWPELRWRRWRYEVRELEIDLLRGRLAVARTLVPMQRIQHVDTRRGVLEQALGLATVVFYTAAGANSIPALENAEAAAVRDRIAELTRTPDDI